MTQKMNFADLSRGFAGKQSCEVVVVDTDDVHWLPPGNDAMKLNESLLGPFSERMKRGKIFTLIFSSSCPKQTTIRLVAPPNSLHICT